MKPGATGTGLAGDGSDVCCVGRACRRCADLGGGRPETEMEAFQDAEEVARPVLEHVSTVGVPELVDAVHECLEAEVELSTGERSPEAVVRADPERQMSPWTLAIELHVAGGLKLALVAVRRTEAKLHDRPRGDRDAVELHVDPRFPQQAL